MRDSNFYRYFLASRPNPPVCALLVALRGSTGQLDKPVATDRLHLTWCVIAETLERDRFMLPRVEAALSGQRLSSGPLWLGRVRGGKQGAAVYSRSRKPELLRLYRQLASILSVRDIHPMYRKSGLDPHITLGHDPCAFQTFRILHEWIPDELLLIESEVGCGVHHVLARWPLLPPLQGLLLFEPLPPPLVLVAGGAG
ncbi:MAG TPA: hypothetical protein VLK25_14005 [Allosphingosinicella sp.]|nr:hypothetical protein [Allosphingosinicella sp.]